ncbi:MAG: DNA internalization-related competence protein ComEC/Rec2 [Gemmatimonadota bacterium]
MAHAAGIALPLLGASLPPALLLFLLLGALLLLWRRPWPAGVLVAAAVAGMASGAAVVHREESDCRLHLPRRWDGEVTGRFLTRVSSDGSFPFRIEEGGPGEVGGPDECRGVVRALLPRGATLPRAGGRIRVASSWEGRAFPQPGLAEWAGRLRLAGDWEPAPGGGPWGKVLVLRGAIQERMVALWGERTAPMVEALVLARREHLDPELRDAFALSGTAHLLAISGFHVGVVAGILLGLLRLVGLGRRAAEGGAAAGCWSYVLAIGAPHAAVRAAVLLTLLVAARVRGRPVVPAGALGSALLLLLVFDPGWLASVGFQLSFAGTAGLVLLRDPVSRALDRGWKTLTGRERPGRGRQGLGADLLKGGAAGIVAGVSATLPTLPFLAWHFDRVSLIGIPATLAVAPAVAAAIPGIGAGLFLSLFSMTLGRFAAGGSGLLLDGVGRAIRWTAALPGASFWVSRGALIAAALGGIAVYFYLRRGYAGRVGPGARRLAATTAGTALVLLLPLLPLGRDLELHLIDVGQGDAVALRTPRGRWLLVDAGPRSAGFDSGTRRVVPYLRRHGARGVEALVLTHPHLDHIGGAPGVIAGIGVRGILDPSRPYGSGPYLAVLEAAREEGIWWWVAREGSAFQVDGLRIEVLHPDAETADAPELADPNDLSVVLLVRWGEGAVLLTGDAPAAVERRVLERVPRLSVLKVGHHGSRTSTSPEFLAATHPGAALIGVGDPNGFGHPHDVVVERLEAAGARIFRTDRDGDVRVRIRRDGTVHAETSR